MDKNILFAAAGLGALILLSSSKSEEIGGSGGGEEISYTPLNDITPTSQSQLYGQPSVVYNLSAPIFPETKIPTQSTTSTPTYDPTYGGTARYSQGLGWQSINPSISKKETSAKIPSFSFINSELGYENPYSKQSVLYPSKKESAATPISNPYTNPQSVDLKNIYKIK